MRVLGISASVALEHEDIFDQLGVSGSGHDSAAVIVEDGEIIVAIEQERLDRIKHSNKVPIASIKKCLDKCDLTLDDIDYIAVNYREDSVNLNLQENFLDDQNQKKYRDIKSYIERMFQEGFGARFNQKRVYFVPHNKSHAESVLALSGFKESLVLVTDGMGDDSAGVIQDYRNGQVKTLHKIPVDQSLGNFYIQSIRYLGYGAHDEYKVMGLAPYGNPDKYKRYFNKIVRLLPEGKYEINPVYSILFQIGQPRRKGEPFTQVHKDIAAGIQSTLERIIMHVLEYYQQSTGQKNLCIAGGVAHNCSVNGKILYSGLFDNVFVQPAAHDAGAVMGAALAVWNQKKYEDKELNQMNQVYFGFDIGDNNKIHSMLNKWKPFLEFHKSDDVIEETAQLLVDQKIIGWVQNASEFGPRALGNRSILADPRPAENKKIINKMVKKREGYRPFAPSILEEYIEYYFEVPKCNAPYYFMNFILKVKLDKQKLLGAVTHVDGTARIQTVSKQTNNMYWNLIDRFRTLTGIPILLNTSFNNNAEPIVDSIEDAIICFLTTKLHYLVIGDYVINKKDFNLDAYKKLMVSIPKYTKIHSCSSYKDNNIIQNEYSLGVTYNKRLKVKISKVCYEFLLLSKGCIQMEEGLLQLDKDQLGDELVNELIELWEKRLIVMRMV